MGVFEVRRRLQLVVRCKQSSWNTASTSHASPDPPPLPPLHSSQEPAVQQQLLGLNAVGRCMDYVREKSCPGRNDLLVMLLANLTSLEAGAEALLQVGRGQGGRARNGLHAARAAGHASCGASLGGWLERRNMAGCGRCRLGCSLGGGSAGGPSVRASGCCCFPAPHLRRRLARERWRA